jgi:hypothetical protein
VTDDEWEQQRRTQLTNRRVIGWMTLERSRTPIGQFAHGTRYGYDKKKCRCEQCREWMRQYKRERWARRHPNAKPRPKARKS